MVKSDNSISIAFIYTRYQFNILIELLKSLNIAKSSVIIIIANKAEKQGVSGKGFNLTIDYDESHESMKYWAESKKNLINELNIVEQMPNNLFLRNFNSACARIILSRFYNSNLYILEEGMGSYFNCNYLGLYGTLKEKIVNILKRFYFSKGKLKILPIYKERAKKVGLFPNMKPWLNIPYYPIRLTEKQHQKQKLISDEIDVLIVDQPLWQVGLKDEETIQIYKSILSYLQLNGLENKKTAIKLHPSSKKCELLKLIRSAGFNDKTIIIDSRENIEEWLFSEQFNSIKMFIGFFSWALCLIHKHKYNRTIPVLAFSNNLLDQKAHQSYEIMQSMGIKIIRDIKGR